QAPRLTLNGSVNYEHPVGHWDTTNLVGFFNINASYRSKYNTGSDLNPNKIQEAFALVNAQLGIKNEDDSLELALWGRNIFDKHYNVVAFNTPVGGPSGGPIAPGTGNSIFSSISVFPGEPAIYGVSLSARY